MAADQNDLLDAALQYAARGWRVFPVRGKVPAIRTGRRHAAASTDPAVIEAWWGRMPAANVGIATGMASGICVVDVDGPGGLRLLRGVIGLGGVPLPRTLVARSGRPDGGAHLYFSIDTPIRNSSGDGLDLRGDGGLVVGPPSRHASGTHYGWVDGTAALAPLPGWLRIWFETRGGQKRAAPKSPGSGRKVPDYLQKRLDGIGPRLADRAVAVLDGPVADGDVAAALAAIDNPDMGWDEWNKMGMTVWAATAGSEAGLAAFMAWSAKSKKYLNNGEAKARERWAHYPTSPPTDLGFGSLVHMARAAVPGWGVPSRAIRAIDPHGAIAAHADDGAKPGSVRQPVPAGRQQAVDTALGGEVGIPPSANALPAVFATEEEKEGSNGHAAAGALLGEEFGSVLSDKPLIDLNKRYSVIGDIGGKCLVLSMVRSKVDEAVKVPSFQSFKAFSERYASQYVAVRRESSKGELIEEPRQVGAWWLKWTGRKSYEGIDLVPGGAAVLPGHVLNLWTGFAVVPRAGGWPLMRRHIVDVLAAGDLEAARYIVRFAAWAVQHPGDRAEVALVFRGGKGSGKGTFANALRRLFGQHGLQIFNSKHLVGSFNGHLRNCLLLFADEAFWAGDRQGESVLKGMLTESVLMIEQKGVDATQWRNRLHVIMAANADWVVPASHDERRYAMFDVDNGRIGDRAYFDALHAELAAGGLAAMLNDLLALRLDGWHPREVPHNEALRQQKINSLDAKAAWLESKLQSGRLKHARKGEPNVAAAADLLEDCRQFSLRPGDVNATNLGLFLKRWGGVGLHKRDGNLWELPELKALRLLWISRYGMWNWQEPFEKWQL